MFATLTAACCLLLAPVPQTETPVGPVPLLVDLKPDADGRVRVNVMRTATVAVTETVIVAENGVNRVVTRQRQVPHKGVNRVELKEVADLVIRTADGKAADRELVLKKLSAEGGPVVVSADGKAVDPKFLKLFRDETLILSAAELMPQQQAAVAGGVQREVFLQPGVRAAPALPIAPPPAQQNGGNELPVAPPVPVRRPVPLPPVAVPPAPPAPPLR